MKIHTTIDGDRVLDIYMYGNTSITLNVKRYNGGMRGGILVFGAYGVLGTISYDDKSHGINTQYHAATGQQLNCRTITDDGTNLQIEVSNIPSWTWYTFIGCNCWFT